MRRWFIALGALALFTPSPATAQAEATEAPATETDGTNEDDEPIFGATAEVERPMPSGTSDDPTASATRIDLAERRELVVAERFSELLREAPGAQPRRTGGLGTSSGLSLRGSDLDQVSVTIDGAPLGAPGEAVDLSLLPPAMFDAADVYRGGAPLSLGGGAIGGTLNLVPTARRGLSARLGIGSFGTLRGAATAGVSTRRLSLHAAVGATTTSGDFPYLDDGGTRFITSDDRERKRRNANVDAGYLLITTRAELPRVDLAANVFAVGQTGGFAAAASLEPLSTRRRHAELRVGTTVNTRGEGARYGLDTQVSLTQHRLTDLFAEIGVPRATQDRRVGTFVRLRGEHPLSDSLSLHAAASYRLDHLIPEDALARVPNVRSTRHHISAGTELAFRTSRQQLRLTLRGGLVRGTLGELRDERSGAESRTLQFTPNARLSYAVRIRDGLALTASVNAASRPPSMLELFGDRGYVLGDTRLRPERGLAGDLGLSGRGRRGPLQGSFEVHAFARAAFDRVQFVRNAQFQISPRNIDRARFLGVTASVVGELGPFRLLTTLSWLDARDREGRQLPLLRAFTLTSRASVRTGPVSFFAAITATGRSYGDPANLVALPAQQVVDVGVAFRRDRVLLQAVMRDALDARPFDLVGFPLPGRRFSLDLTIRSH